MFRRTRSRSDRHERLVGPRDVDQWFAELRQAANAELPPGMDPDHRARLLIELVDAMHRMDPPDPPEPRPQGHKPRQYTVLTEAKPGRRSPRHAMPTRRQLRRAEPKSLMNRLHRIPKTVQAGIIVVVVVLIGVVGVFMTRPGTDGSATGLTKIRVAVLPVVDVAPFYRALDAGYFADEGLSVDMVVADSGPAAIENLTAGRLDIAFTSYPGVLKAQSERHADLKIIAPAYTADTSHLMLVSKPGGPIGKAEDVAGKRIAVTSVGSISDLGAMSELRARNVDTSKIQWVQLPMPEIGPAIQRGDVDGGVIVEPYIQLNNRAFNALPILDVALGATARIPLSGYVARSQTDETPNAVDRFVRALRHGIDDVSDREVLEPLLVKYLGIDADTAKHVRIAQFPKDLDAGQIQRVADLMLQFAVINRRLDVKPMLR
ncbi:ABC transporter substrate-binding protein [Kibdelosporangium aridum]|uniref:NitT/TauT family transport system substrate-binding protein n=1 Tax=Kibdelosporangium aridum TaxID=2030 RepID=A0A1Y5WV59_KIBAR|nr:ABC transporter substrate-binding protein [Kibdelosporangium aridum]SMC53015.1 NitT/TauT family transport system substrate-binding protein [Kibdelosporangium aridum]